MTDFKVLVAGAGGAMGRAVLKSAIETSAPIGGGFDHANSGVVGQDLGTLIGTGAIGQLVHVGIPNLAHGNVIIDFTRPEASLAHIRAAGAAGAAIVVGTTGFSDAEEAEILALSKSVPIVKSGNMSLGINLLCALVLKASKTLSIDFDIEITEAHHRRKVDAPSGTALMLGEAAAAGRGVPLKDKIVTKRNGITDQRRKGDIGFSAMRGGGIIGTHDVHFVSENESMTLSHQAFDRSLFAQGAITAAKWVADKPNGLFTMFDVLGLES